MADREGPIQRSIIAYLRRVLPGAIIHHSANELNMRGADAARIIAKSKAAGMLPGFPDILIFHRGQGYCIEVKAEGGKLSPAQRDVRDLLIGQGIPWAVCRSIDDTRERLAAWGVETNDAQVVEISGEKR